MRFAIAALMFAAGLCAEDSRHDALSRVYALSERIARFDDHQSVVNSLLSLGTTVCRYDLAAAEAVFGRAALQVRDSRREPEEYERARGVVLAYAARCNADLAEQLRTQTEPTEKDLARSTYAVLPEASGLLKEDPARAARIAASVLPALSSMNADQLSEFHEFLQQLRAEDGALADRLYADALSQLATRPRLTSLQLLGNHVFGPPGGSPATSSTSINGVEVFDWTVRRENVSDQTVKAYLQTVAVALASAGEESVLRAVLARQLKPYADDVAPELASAFGNASAETSVNLSEDIRGASEEDPLNRMARSPLEHVRIQGQVFELVRYCGQKQFDKARDIAAEMEDLSLRAQLFRLTEVEEALAAIREGNLRQVAGIADKMPPGAHQALLYSELASVYRKEDPDMARRTLDLVWHAAGKAGPGMRSYLLLAVSAGQAELEPEKAIATLAEAVRAFNADQPGQSGRSTAVLRPFGTLFLERIVDHDGRMYTLVPIRIGAPELFHFSGALRQFSDSDLDRVDAVVAELISDELLAEAQIRTCEMRLRVAFGKPRSR